MQRPLCDGVRVLFVGRKKLFLFSTLTAQVVCCTYVLVTREMFQCSVLISFWRVRHAWHKNLMKRCSEDEMRAELSRRLGLAVHDICTGSGTVDMFENFMEDFVDCSDFMDYFKAVWHPRMGPWITNLKGMPLASQETCAALELYHSQLKIRLLNEKDPDAYQRVDWLVDKLDTKVQAYFWLDEYSGKDDFSRYWKDEWACGLTAWRKSLMIPDTDVIIDGKLVNVIDQNDRDLFHVVWNPGTEYAICSCNWAEKGNLCEHVFKVVKFFRKKGTVLPSISLVQYDQCLINMLRCPPHDSFIRDHAVALTVWVCEQLVAQIRQESTQEITNPVEQHREAFDNGLPSLCSDSHMVDDSHVSIENNSSNQSVQVELDKTLSAVSMDQHVSEDLNAILENGSSIPSVSVEFDNAVPRSIDS